MSQIIDYGDPELEKEQIHLRHLERVIQPENYTAPIDLSDVVLEHVKQIDQGKTDISLGANKVGLSGLTAAGSGLGPPDRLRPVRHCLASDAQAAGTRSPSRVG